MILVNSKEGIKQEESYLFTKPCHTWFVSKLSNHYSFELLSEISQKYNDKPCIKAFATTEKYRYSCKVSLDCTSEKFTYLNECPHRRQYMQG